MRARSASIRLRAGRLIPRGRARTLIHSPLTALDLRRVPVRSRDMWKVRVIHVVEADRGSAAELMVQ